MRHCISAITLTIITINLLLWIPFLVFFALLKAALPVAATKRGCDFCTDQCYRSAVAVNSWLLEGALGMQINIIGDLPKGRLQRMLVISNHRSWFDIIALQTVIVPHGPIIKFLIKKELIYVPVVGWICLALNFPRLTRGQQPGGREKDFDSVTSAVMELDNSPFALLNFIEGTRFTPAKRDSNNSRYQHLLNPKTGGFRIMLNNLPHADIVDVTLIYPCEMNFWECLSGRLKRLDVHVSCSKADDITDIKQWINARWDEKELLYQTDREAAKHDN
ncbi:MAG: 1-acyl-sn-glycerol-3-phosphate acyltransferase [Saprospiraceae bacterium]